MHCPKCNHEQEDSNYECSRCGVIFEKFFKAQKNKIDRPISEQKDIASGYENSFWSGLYDLFFSVQDPVNKFYFAGRIIIFFVVLVWGVIFIIKPIESNYVGGSFMHLVNLPFHEAGHVIFRPLGKFITSLGGTIGQLLMPLICFAVLIVKTRDTFGASVALWWFGENFIDIAPYINDARALKLPLLGGNIGYSSPYGFHDWEYILKQTGLAKFDHLFAKISLSIGAFMIAVSLIWGGILLVKQYKNLS
ncbi:zinc ribbon domain-containing protein [Thermodesulfobacteriota bacterium]